MGDKNSKKKSWDALFVVVLFVFTFVCLIVCSVSLLCVIQLHLCCSSLTIVVNDYSIA